MYTLFKNIFFIGILLTSFITGALFFCIHHQLIIFQIPATFSQLRDGAQEQHFEKRTVALFIWKDEAWEKEEVELLWSTRPQEAISHIIERWLSFANEEAVIGHKVTIQSVALSHNGNNAYLSFDRSLFANVDSTHHKYMLVESLLKTLRENGLKLSYVHLLVNQKLVDDHHLDCTHGWPLYGFLTDSIN